MRLKTAFLFLSLIAFVFPAIGCAGAEPKPAAPVSATPAPATAKPEATATPAAQTAPTEIELVQTPGQFEKKELKLKPGQYVFKIVNKGVKHEVGFYLQTDNDKGKGVDHSEAGHVKDGEVTKTGTVTLDKGKYVYSCPLNPTPHYIITVE